MKHMGGSTFSGLNHSVGSDNNKQQNIFQKYFLRTLHKELKYVMYSLSHTHTDAHTFTDTHALFLVRLVSTRPRPKQDFLGVTQILSLRV